MPASTSQRRTKPKVRRNSDVIQTENDIVRNMKQIFQKLGDEYLKFINPNSKCINLPNTIENRQIIKTLRNWKPELISQTESMREIQSKLNETRSSGMDSSSRVNNLATLSV